MNKVIISGIMLLAGIGHLFINMLAPATDAQIMTSQIIGNMWILGSIFYGRQG